MTKIARHYTFRRISCIYSHRMTRPTYSIRSHDIKKRLGGIFMYYSNYPYRVPAPVTPGLPLNPVVPQQMYGQPFGQGGLYNQGYGQPFGGYGQPYGGYGQQPYQNGMYPYQNQQMMSPQNQMTPYGQPYGQFPQGQMMNPAYPQFGQGGFTPTPTL